MKTKSMNVRFATLTLMILITAFSRIIPHPYGFTSIGAFALFGGKYFSERWKAYLLPMLALWLSDLFLSYFQYHKFEWFYGRFYWTYISFALMVFLGSFIKKANFASIFVASIAAVFVHWVVSDFGVWLDGSLYPQTLKGFIACYTAAIPYERTMLWATLAYSVVLFGVFELAQRKFPALVPKTA